QDERQESLEASAQSRQSDSSLSSAFAAFSDFSSPEAQSEPSNAIDEPAREPEQTAEPSWLSQLSALPQPESVPAVARNTVQEDVNDFSFQSPAPAQVTRRSPDLPTTPPPVHAEAEFKPSFDAPSAHGISGTTPND